MIKNILAIGVGLMVLNPAYATEKPAPIPDQIFETAAHETIPLSPAEVREFKARVEDFKRAQNEPLETASPIVRTTVIDLRPGSLPEKLFLKKGYETSVTFLDVQGNPWPIKHASVGDEDVFVVSKNIDNVASIKVKQEYRPSNLTVVLVGLNKPIVVALEQGTSSVEFSRVLSVPQLNPAFASILSNPGGGTVNIAGRKGVSIPHVNHDVLGAFLGNTPPSEAVPVSSLGGDIDVWSYSGKLIVRTEMHLLAPEGRPLFGEGSWKVYELDSGSLRNNQVLSFLSDGEPVMITLLTDALEEVK